jgi:Raf kinase inhibitor-like YbhB/YbcL family protein
MKKLTITLLLALVATQAAALDLKSSDMSEGRLLTNDQVFNGFGCTGKNISPQLSWSGVPAGTRSIAITAYDPDAPTGSGWWHWVVVNLPADTRELPRGVSGNLKQGLEVETDFGKPGFGGACPPEGHGMHRYQFTVWALKAGKVDVNANSPAALVGFMLNSMAIDKATLTATYFR